MGKSNKSARRDLERLYGKECFIEKLKLKEKYGEGKKYTGKNQVKKAIESRNKQLTYHHMIERKDGGPATVENGALLSAENHVWFNKQPKAIQEKMNNDFRRYKAECDMKRLGIIEFATEGIIDYEQITFDDMGIGYETIRLEDNTEEDKEFLDVTEGMSEAEIREYKKHKRQRNERVKEKFGSEQVSEQVNERVERPHAHIDEEWSREIMNDVLDELRY
jgi:hypothetical protein